MALGHSQSQHGRNGAGAPKRKGESAFAIIMFLMLIGAMLWWGWNQHDSPEFTPGRGSGYWLGIIGSSAMALLLLYPLRKRMRFMRTWGRTADWFRWHMALGILGPTLIVLHANFHIQSMNSSVAFGSMLIVAGSGIVGRYLYGQIHRGLYGEQLKAQELLGDSGDIRTLLADCTINDTELNDALIAIDAIAVAPVRSLFAAFWRAFAVAKLTRETRALFARRMRDYVKREPTESRAALKKVRKQADGIMVAVEAYLSTARSAARLAPYERLFGLWHVLHVPLFILLVIAAVIHIVAVHFY